MFNIEWLYQLKNEIHQITWKPKWGRIAVRLPKYISNKIFIGNDSYKYIYEMPPISYFEPQYFKGKYVFGEKDENTQEKVNKIWCWDEGNVYGWHFCNNIIWIVFQDFGNQLIIM
eukprot:382060_1